MWPFSNLKKLQCVRQAERAERERDDAREELTDASKTLCNSIDTLVILVNDPYEQVAAVIKESDP